MRIRWQSSLLLISLVFCFVAQSPANLDIRACGDCNCPGQWEVETWARDPEIVDSRSDTRTNRFCIIIPAEGFCITGFNGVRVEGSVCENLDCGSEFQIQDNIQIIPYCAPAINMLPCQKVVRTIENKYVVSGKIYKCMLNGREMCRESRTRQEWFFELTVTVERIPNCNCVPTLIPIPGPEQPEEPEEPPIRVIPPPNWIAGR